MCWQIVLFFRNKKPRIVISPRNCLWKLLSIANDNITWWQCLLKKNTAISIRFPHPAHACVCIFVYRLLCTDKLLHINESIKIYWHSANNVVELIFLQKITKQASVARYKWCVPHIVRLWNKYSKDNFTIFFCNKWLENRMCRVNCMKMVFCTK